VLADGREFPQRNLILFITFVTILLTLVVQGLTLPFLIRRLHVFDGLIHDEAAEAARQKLKLGLKRHVHQFLKDKYERQAGMEGLMKMWEEKAKAMNDELMTERTKAILLEILLVQRQYLTELNKDPAIGEEMIRTELYQIDLEEERLKII
jgi:NhaP-type Na+/H+ or K+/H+ antiporter